MQPLPIPRTDLASARAAETVVGSAGGSRRLRDGSRSSQKTGASYANSGDKWGVHQPAVRIFVRNRYLFSSDAFVHHAVMFYAHSGNDDSKADWQPLRAHLFATADLASRLAAPLGLSAAAYAAGLFHDLGKYTPEFQKRLTGAETPVDHATAGARAMLEHLAAGPEDKLMAELIAYAIAGHHAGLPDRKNDTAACLDLRVKQSLPALDPAWKAEIGESVSGLAPPFLRTLRKEDFQFSLSVMGRMLFSCLVDAGAWIEIG